MLFSKKKGALLAVADGKAVPLSSVPDEAFSSGILGIGIAVEPTAGTIYSPIDGVVESITETGHAYSIQSSDGLDVLVHVGIDTVELKGDGFLPMVSEGDRIKAGEVLARVDLDAVRSAGHPTVIPILITNPQEVESIQQTSDASVTGGKSVILEYRPKS